MTQLAKDIWARLVPSFHFWMAGIAVGGLSEKLKPGLFFSAAIATILVFEAYNRMTYTDKDD